MGENKDMENKKKFPTPTRNKEKIEAEAKALKENLKKRREQLKNREAKKDPKEEN